MPKCCASTITSHVLNTRASRYRFSSNPFQKLKLELERKYKTFGGFDWTEFAAPFKKNKTRKDMGHNPFFKFFYEQCQRKHALQIAERMGLSIGSVTFDGNKAYIDSNLPIPKHQMNEIARNVKRECPMSKLNDIVGNQETEWIQKK